MNLAYSYRILQTANTKIPDEFDNINHVKWNILIRYNYQVIGIQCISLFYTIISFFGKSNHILCT